MVAARPVDRSRRGLDRDEASGRDGRMWDLQSWKGKGWRPIAYMRPWSIALLLSAYISEMAERRGGEGPMTYSCRKVLAVDGVPSFRDESG